MKTQEEARELLGIKELLGFRPLGQAGPFDSFLIFNRNTELGDTVSLLADKIDDVTYQLGAEILKAGIIT